MCGIPVGLRCEDVINYRERECQLVSFINGPLFFCFVCVFSSHHFFRAERKA